MNVGSTHTLSANTGFEFKPELLILALTLCTAPEISQADILKLPAIHFKHNIYYKTKHKYLINCYRNV